jgi:UDP-N-acetylmuramoyl-tripeptide--D-alanyl-D-alanine ligase
MMYVDIEREGETPLSPEQVLAMKPTLVLTVRPQSYEGTGYSSIVCPPDPIKALVRLGAWRRALYDVPVVGVTGSVGKSSTVELLGHLLARHFGVVALTTPEENDELGVPIMCANLDSSVKAIVAEMATWRHGEIRDCALACQPGIAVITAIDRVHLARFGTVEAIQRAKAELFEAIAPHGLGVIPVDDHLTRSLWRDYADVARACSLVDSNAYSYAERVSTDAQRTYVQARIGDNRIRFSLPMSGPGHVRNALTAATVAFELGLTADEIAYAMSTYRRCLDGRLQTVYAADGVTVVNDGHNAAVASCRELSWFLKCCPFRRRIVVFGGIAEAGGQEPDVMSDAIGCLWQGADQVIAFGPAARYACGSTAVWPQEQVVGRLMEIVKSGDIVAFKGSANTGASSIAHSLAEALGGQRGGDESDR